MRTLGQRVRTRRNFRQGVDVPIEHVYVLMLENRSFDHMLGFSNIAGADAVTGRPTAISGLTGNESSFFDKKEYRVERGADRIMQIDPPHEFADVTHQLCGPAVKYTSGGPYPAINCSGFIQSYMDAGGQNPRDIMKCFTPDEL